MDEYGSIWILGKKENHNFCIRADSGLCRRIKSVWFALRTKAIELDSVLIYSQRHLLHSQRGTALYDPGNVFVTPPLAPQSKRYSAVRTRRCLYSQRDLLHSQRGTAVYEPGNALFATRLAPQSKSYRAIQTQRDSSTVKELQSCTNTTRFSPQTVTELYKRITICSTVKELELHKCTMICSTVKELQSYRNARNASLFQSLHSQRVRAIQTQRDLLLSQRVTELYKLNAIPPQSKSYRAIQTQHDLLHSQRVTELYKLNTICSTVKELQSYKNTTRFAPQSKSYRAIQTQRDLLHSQRVRATQTQHNLLHSQRVTELYKRTTICSTVKELQSYRNARNASLFQSLHSQRVTELYKLNAIPPQSKSYRAIQTQRDLLLSQRVTELYKQNAICSTVKELQSYTNRTRSAPQSKSYRAIQTQRDLLLRQRGTALYEPAMSLFATRFAPEAERCTAIYISSCMRIGYRLDISGHDVALSPRFDFQSGVRRIFIEAIVLRNAYTWCASCLQTLACFSCLL